VRNGGTIILLQRHLLLRQRGGSHLWCDSVSEYGYCTLQVRKWRSSYSFTETFQTQVETKMTPNKIDSIDSAILSQSSQMSLRPSRRFTSSGWLFWGQLGNEIRGGCGGRSYNYHRPLSNHVQKYCTIQSHYIFLSRVCIGWQRESGIVSRADSINSLLPRLSF